MHRTQAHRITIEVRYVQDFGRNNIMYIMLDGFHWMSVTLLRTSVILNVQNNNI